MDAPVTPEEFGIPAGYRVIYCKAFRHAKTGKLMRAEDYGRQSWRFVVPIKPRKKPTKPSDDKSPR